MSAKSLEDLGSYYWDDDDDEDETLQRHAYHPSASSRHSPGQSFASGTSRSISSVSLTSVRSPEANNESCGRIRIAAPTNDRNVPDGLDGMVNIEDYSLDEIIKLKKVKAPPKSLNPKALKGWERSRGQRSAYQENPKGRHNLKRSRTQMMLEEESISMGFTEKPMRKNRRINRPAEIKYTPEAGLRNLVEQGFVINIRVFENSNEDDVDFHARRWRAVVVDVRDNSVEGIGEGRRKQLAKDSASLDFLQNLKRKRPELAIQNCDILKGVRISPLISKDFIYLCQRLQLEQPTCVEDLVMINGTEKYKFTVIVGQLQFSSTSFVLKYARIKALKKAFDALNDDGVAYELDPVIMGDDCSDGSCYNLNETEQVNIVHSRTPGIQAWKCDESYLYTPMGALAKTAAGHRYADGDPLDGEFSVSPGAGYSKSATLQHIRQFMKGQANSNPEQGGYENSPTSGMNSSSNGIPTYHSFPASTRASAQMNPPVFSGGSEPSFFTTEQSESEYMNPMPQSGFSRSTTPLAFENRLQRLNIQTPEGSVDAPVRPSSALSNVSRSFGTFNSTTSQGFHGPLSTSLSSTGPLALSAAPHPAATCSKRVTVPNLNIPAGFSVAPSGSVLMTGFGARTSQLGSQYEVTSQDPTSLNNIRQFWHRGLRAQAVAAVNQYDNFPVDHQDKFGGEGSYGIYFGSLPEDVDESGGVTTRMIFTGNSGSMSFNLANYRSKIGLADAIDKVNSVLGADMQGRIRYGNSAGKSNPFR